MNRQRLFVFALLGVALAVGCEKGGDGPAAGADGDKATTKDFLFTGLSFNAAKAKAAESGKLVMIDFGAEWCGWCKKLDENTWKDPKVQGWLKEKAICLKVDTDELKGIAAQYRVSGIPVIAFVDGSGKMVKRLTGYRDAAAFLKETEGLSAK